MLERIADSPWLVWLLETLYLAQHGLAQGLAKIGKGNTIDGQAAWPWSWRISGDNLLLDIAQARQFAFLLLALALALLLLLLACFWRRGRALLSGSALLMVLLVPWPSASVILTKAYPTSFHQPTVEFSDLSISRGSQVYTQHCINCHGERGTGRGADAGSLHVWPPNFVGPLLWRRADGDLLWAIRHGMRDADGATTMPGLAEQLSIEDTWHVLHYLKALGAGQLLRATGNWALPVRLPELRLRCHFGDTRHSSAWQGQYLRLTTMPAEDLRPDPRLVTLWLPADADPNRPIPNTADCIVDSVRETRLAISLLTGASDIGDMQLLTDRQGWLRALNGRGAVAWSDEDLLCRNSEGLSSGGATALSDDASSAPPRGDALGRILRIMDAEPVLYVKGGRVH